MLEVFAGALRISRAVGDFLAVSRPNASGRKGAFTGNFDRPVGLGLGFDVYEQKLVNEDGSSGQASSRFTFDAILNPTGWDWDRGETPFRGPIILSGSIESWYRLAEPSQRLSVSNDSIRKHFVSFSAFPFDFGMFRPLNGAPPWWASTPLCLRALAEHRGPAPGGSGSFITRPVLQPAIQSAPEI